MSWKSLQPFFKGLAFCWWLICSKLKIIPCRELQIWEIIYRLRWFNYAHKKDVKVCVWSCFFPGPVFGHRNWGLEILARNKTETDHAADSFGFHSHAHIHVSHRCFYGGPGFSLPQEIAGKVSLPESTHPNPAERVALLGCCLPQTSRDTEEAVSTLVSLFWRR